MTKAVSHTFVSVVADDSTSAANGEVLPSHWNAVHTLTDIAALSANTFTSTQTIVPATNVGGLVLQAHASATAATPALTFKDSSAAESGRIHFDGSTTYPGGSVFIGSNAGKANTVTATFPEGLWNTFVGYFVGEKNTTGNYNAAFGTHSLNANTSGTFNVAIGANALLVNLTGVGNVALGCYALTTNSTGGGNVALGYKALQYTTTSNNTAVGDSALRLSAGAQYGSALGSNALGAVTSGSGNCAFGINAGATLTTGGYNTFFGYSADASTNALTKTIAIGANAIVAASNSCAIGGASGADNVKVGINMTTPAAWLHLPAGSTTVAPLKFTSGTNETTAEAGAMEYNGTNLFFTRSGTAREGVLTQSAVTTEALTSDTSVTVNIGGTTYKLLAKA
jgi:hypothetical protein